MAESCTNFNPHLWKSNICRDCTRRREDHPNFSINKIQTLDVPLSTPHQVTDDDDQSAHSHTVEQNLVPPIQESTQVVLPRCRYGLKCYRTNPDHFEHYSHPPGYISNPARRAIVDDEKSTYSFAAASGRETNSKKTSDVPKHEELRFIELVEKHVKELIANSNLKDNEIKKLRQDQMKMVRYHQDLEKALADELELREKRELERQHILVIPRQAPSYWGPNAFSKSYHEIQISNGSPEFCIINDLLNSTITTHDNNYGTIYGQDSTEFLVKQVKRIHNIRLWHEYCYKKDSIIAKNNHRLPDSGGSIHLQNYPILTPLLDSQANEYWLFHGCSHDTLDHLLHTGYDPRVSSLKGMFGGGFYLAENSSKSNQYIPCPKCNGNAIFTSVGCNCSDQETFVFSMVLYRAVLGDVHVALTYDRQKYRDGTGKGKYVRRPPKKTAGQELYDSVMGESIKNDGDRLQHREFILYEPGQAYPEYVIDFQRSAENARPPTDMKRLQYRCQNFLKNTFRIVPE